MDRFAHPGVHLSIVAVSGDAEIAGSYSLIVAGGDVKVGPLMESMLICDGDVELAGPPENGLIIARGKVTCRGRPLRGSVVRSENYYQLHNGEKIIIENGTPDPVAFVRFFELSDVGLVASSGNVKGKAIRAGVRLKEVRKDSPFADALRAGDAVMALDGTEVTSAETFRRLLRRKLAQTAPGFTVTVRRGKETLDLSIPMKD